MYTFASVLLLAGLSSAIKLKATQPDGPGEPDPKGERTYLDTKLVDLDDEDIADLIESDPLCYLGVHTTPDKNGPEPHCCRGYELKNFIGKYMDFCLKDGKASEYTFDDIWGYTDWDEEISSFWCGNAVNGELCHTQDETTCEYG